jgi:hypothetical protein
MNKTLHQHNSTEAFHVTYWQMPLRSDIDLVVMNSLLVRVSFHLTLRIRDITKTLKLATLTQILIFTRALERLISDINKGI